MGTMTVLLPFYPLPTGPATLVRVESSVMGPASETRHKNRPVLMPL